MKSLLLLISCLLVIPSLYAADASWVHGQAGRVYKWVDNNGETQYTQYPPGGSIKYTEVEQAYPAGSEDSQSTDEAGGQVADAGDEGATPKSPDERLSTEELNNRNCVTARNNLALLETPETGVAYVDAEGKTVNIDTKARAARIETAKKQIEEFCK